MAYSVHPQIVPYKTTARNKAVDPCTHIRPRGSLWQAELGAGSSPFLVSVCVHCGQAHTQRLGCHPGCELLFKRLYSGSCPQLGKGLLPQQRRSNRQKRRPGEVGKRYIAGEEVSECKALELYPYKELVLSPGKPVRHRPWTIFSREVIKKWGTSGSDDSVLSTLLTMSSCCRL